MCLGPGRMLSTRQAIDKPVPAWNHTAPVRLTPLLMRTWKNLYQPWCRTVAFYVGAETFARLKVSVRSGLRRCCRLPPASRSTKCTVMPPRDRYYRAGRGRSFITAPTGFRYAKVMVLSPAGRRRGCDRSCRSSTPAIPAGTARPL